MQDTLLLDANCGLCSRAGKFISKRLSKNSNLIIGEQDSEQGKAVIASLPESIQASDSLYLIRNDKPYHKSSAAIRCLLYLKPHWKFLFPFAWLMPLPIRDFAYDFIAKRRHDFQ